MIICGIVVINAKALTRPKHMDEWSMEQLGAWFDSLKLSEHITYITSNRIDGLLFINLTDNDWTEIGIINKIQIKKLQIVMKSYRIRYQRKLNGEGDDDDDLSEYSPSELSELVGQYQESDEDESLDGDNDDHDEQVL